MFGEMARAEVRAVDSGHLVPMERPDLVVDAVLAPPPQGDAA